MQVVFHKEMRERKYTASFIDFGYCFNAGVARLFQSVEAWYGPVSNEEADRLCGGSGLKAKRVPRAVRDVKAPWKLYIYKSNHGHHRTVSDKMRLDSTGNRR